jgi:methionyl-tRNA formyltransferase
MQRETFLGPEETTGEVEARLATIGAGLLAETLAGIEGGSVHPRAQVVDRESYAPKIRPEAARLDWRMPAEELSKRIRAFNPRPGAFTSLHRRVVKIWRATEPGPGGERDATASPGTVQPSGTRLRVACGGDTILEILEIQMEGRRRVSGEEALRGRWFSAGDRFDGSDEIGGGSVGPPPAGV